MAALLPTQTSALCTGLPATPLCIFLDQTLDDATQISDTLLDLSLSYDSICSSPPTPSSSDVFAPYNFYPFSFTPIYPTPSPPQPQIKPERINAPIPTHIPVFPNQDVCLPLPPAFPAPPAQFNQPALLLSIHDPLSHQFQGQNLMLPFSPQAPNTTKMKQNPITPKPTADVPAPHQQLILNQNNSNKSDSSAHNPPAKKSSRRPRTKQQLEKCRQESARARERKKYDRLRLDQLITDKTQESEQLKQQVLSLESEVQQLRQFVLTGALSTLQTQPGTATASLATHVLSYVSQLLQGSCALAPQHGPLIATASPVAKPAPLREIRPRGLEDDAKMEMN